MALKDDFPSYWKLFARIPGANLVGYPCAALESLDRLARREQLRSFRAAVEDCIATDTLFGIDGASASRRMTQALIRDLEDVGELDRWKRCQASVNFGIRRLPHQWLEHDGYAVDIADGVSMCFPAAQYESLARAENLRKTP